MRLDGLNISNMNISYGGAVHQIRDTTVVEVGPYSSPLKVGDVQRLLFVDGDAGPFWMKYAERLETKDDIVMSEVITKQKTKTELLIELRKKV